VAAGPSALFAEAPVAFTALRLDARQALDAGSGAVMVALAGRLALER
jgi:hypothetical protein